MKSVTVMVLALLLPTVTCAGGGDLDYQGILADRQHVFYFDALLFDGMPVPDSSLSLIPLRIRASKMSMSSTDALMEDITGCFVVADKGIPTLLFCSPSSSRAEFRGVTYSFVGKAATVMGARFTCIKQCGPRVPRLFKLIEWAASTE